MLPVPRSSAINRIVSIPVTAGNSPQNSTPATSATTGDSAPPNITCIGYSTPTGPSCVRRLRFRLNRSPVSTRNPNIATYPAGPVKYAANSRRMRAAVARMGFQISDV